MVRNEKMGKVFPNKFRMDFLGGSYTGGRVWGECWEIKDKIGEKKNSGGQKFCRGTFGGNAKKRGEPFWGECWGSCEPQQILGGEFLEKCQRENLGGKFWWVVRRGACDAVGMVRNEKKGKFSPKNLGDFFRGGRIQGDVCVGGTAEK